MTTLIIPCAGDATLNGKPTCLAIHPDGLTLFEKCISGMNLNYIERIVITILQTDNLKYEMETKIHKIFDSYPNRFDIYTMPFKTSSPAETIYFTIKNMKISGRIMIKDVDNFVVIENLYYENFVAGLNIFNYDIRKLGTKSFITVNEQNHVLDIIEKQIKSNIICSGFYGLKRAQDFCNAYDSLRDQIYGIEKLYVSHIIAYLIGKSNAIFQYVEVNNFESYDSQEDWYDVENNLMQSQIQKNRLAIFDLDGTLFNTNDVNYHAYKEALENFGFKFEYEYWHKHCIGRHYKDFLADINITDEKVLHDIHQLKKQCYKKYLNYAQENHHLFEIIELIKPKYYIALVTTASKKNVEDILTTFNKINIFDKIFTQEDVTKMKPNPEGYLKAMKYFNIEASETIIFEDSEAGLKAANDSGAFYYKVFKLN